MNKQKICIVGNGLTGLTTSLVLSKLNIATHLIANFSKGKKLFDNRTTAISPSNYNFLTKFLNKKDLKLFWPSKKIDLYHEQLGQFYHFLNFENKGKNLMYTIKNSELKKAIFQKIKKEKKIKIINTKVKEIDHKNSSIFFKDKAFHYDTILLCVGRNSQLVKKLTGIRSVRNNLNEIALTSIVKHNLNILNSRQYFLKEGPLAILPINKKTFSLIWSINKNYHSNFSKDSIIKKLKEILNSDNKISISKVDSFPISFNLNINFFKKNILVLGEGSYNIHPVAGQGFNLILRDIQKLYEEMDKQISLGLQIKDSSMMHKYVVFRKPENLLFGLSINFIHNFFKNGKISNSFKKIILSDINRFEFFKNLNLRIADSGIFK